MQLTVAVIGRPHGLRGDVGLDVRTDEPEARLAVGTVLRTEGGTGSLTVTRARLLNGRWVVAFAEAADRTAVEALRGTVLVVDVDASQEADAWYPHELRGLRAELPDGTRVGEVVGLEHLPAQDALVVREPDGRTSLVPFVRAIVPEVDVAGGRVVIDPPRGLLASDADAAESAADDAARDLTDGS